MAWLDGLILGMGSYFQAKATAQQMENQALQFAIEHHERMFQRELALAQFRAEEAHRQWQREHSERLFALQQEQWALDKQVKERQIRMADAELYNKAFDFVGNTGNLELGEKYLTMALGRDLNDDDRRVLNSGMTWYRVKSLSEKPISEWTTEDREFVASLSEAYRSAAFNGAQIKEREKKFSELQMQKAEIDIKKGKVELEMAPVAFIEQHFMNMSAEEYQNFKKLPPEKKMEYVGTLVFDRFRDVLETMPPEQRGKFIQTLVGYAERTANRQLHDITMEKLRAQHRLQEINAQGRWQYQTAMGVAQTNLTGRVLLSGGGGGQGGQQDGIVLKPKPMLNKDRTGLSADGDKFYRWFLEPKTNGWVIPERGTATTTIDYSQNQTRHNFMAGIANKKATKTEVITHLYNSFEQYKFYVNTQGFNPQMVQQEFVNGWYNIWGLYPPQLRQQILDQLAKMAGNPANYRIDTVYDMADLAFFLEEKYGGFQNPSVVQAYQLYRQNRQTREQNKNRPQPQPNPQRQQPPPIRTGIETRGGL